MDASAPGPVACREMSCDGSCGLSSINGYGTEAAGRPLPSEERCREFAAEKGLNPEKVIACSRPLSVNGLTFPDPAKAAVPDEVDQMIRQRWHCATVAIPRLAALEALWSSVKNNTGWRVGYNKSFTDACEALRKLEAGL